MVSCIDSCISPSMLYKKSIYSVTCEMAALRWGGTSP